MGDMTFQVRPVGVVASALTDLDTAPRQPDEGAPTAWLVFRPDVAAAAGSVRPGDEIFVLTWLDRARRDLLEVHPRGDRARPVEGVFSTRSPHRPNPIGLHRVTVVEVDGARLRVDGLEAVDGTPILDVKPVLGSEPSAR